ncbi:family 16 glycosylhydrolase [Frankia sp. AgB1.8]|nr:family 16 glycosylhydrolase [Frankia sp. AgB1.8]
MAGEAASAGAGTPAANGPSVLATESDSNVLVVRARAFPTGSVAEISATAGPFGGEAHLRVDTSGRLLLGFRMPVGYSGPVVITVRSGGVSSSVSVDFAVSMFPVPSTPAGSPDLPTTESAAPAPSDTVPLGLEVTAPAAPDGPQPGAGGRWKLAFDDEFSGTSLDRTKWQLCNPSFRSYCLPWNNELQIFNTATTGNANVRVSAGQLHLVTSKEANGQIYSGMVSTGPWPASFGPAPAGYREFTYTYGYYEGRVRIPRGDGFWPSMWELPASNVGGGGWPDSGEFDVFEIPGNNPTDYHFTAHWGGDGGVCGHPCSPQKATISDASANWHTFGLDWQPTGLTWYLDGKKMGATVTDPGALKDTPFFIIANLSVGGTWPPLKGGPDAGTPFPASMDIDWLRVYQRE